MKYGIGVALVLLVAGCRGDEPVPRRIVHADEAPAPQPFGAVSVDSTSGLPLFGPALPELLPVREWTIEQTAVDALSRIGTPTAVTSLGEMLRDPDPELRKDAARGLARMGSDARAAVPQLIAALDDKDPEVRRHATRALGEIGPAASEAVPALVEELRESAKTVEEEKQKAAAEAAKAAAKSGRTAPPAVQPAPSGGS
jgi:HEAT repeat protein